MPPSKLQPLTTKARASVMVPMARRPISTRPQKMISDQNGMGGNTAISGKRKAEDSPTKNEKVKRSALGNVTNAVLNAGNDDNIRKPGNVGPVKPDVAQKLRDVITLKKTAGITSNNNNQNAQALKKVDIASIFPKMSILPPRPAKVMTRAASRASASVNSLLGVENKVIATTVVKQKKKTDIAADNEPKKDASRVPSRRISIEIEQTEPDEESIYMSAHEDL